MTITEKIQDWCDGSLSKLVIEYDNQGRRASGNWETELESNIDRTLKGYRIRLLGSYYTYWMENGRRPGKFPPINVIRQWIDDKGIIPYGNISRDSLAFLIARKIARDGYKGRPVVANVITDQWVQELLDAVGLFYLEEIKSDILKELQKAA